MAKYDLEIVYDKKIALWHTPPAPAWQFRAARRANGWKNVMIGKSDSHKQKHPCLGTRVFLLSKRAVGKLAS